MAGADYGEMIFRNGYHMPDADRLGSGRVQIAFRKNYPVVIIDGVETASGFWLSAYSFDIREGAWADTYESEYRATILGYQFQARHVAGNLLDIELIEPDGTIWQARGGYKADHLAEEDTPEEFYQRLMQHCFRWTPVVVAEDC